MYLWQIDRVVQRFKVTVILRRDKEESFFSYGVNEKKSSVLYFSKRKDSKRLCIYVLQKALSWGYRKQSHGEYLNTFLLLAVNDLPQREDKSVLR